MAVDTVSSNSIISLSKVLIRKKQGVAILPLDEYERMREDLEMAQSKNLAKDIKEARKEYKQGKTISLKDLAKELDL